MSTSTISLMALSGTCGALISSFIAHQQVKNSLYLQEKWRMRDSYCRIGSDLKIFWEAMHGAYEIHKAQDMRTILPKSLPELLDRCGLPPGLLEMSMLGQNIDGYKLTKGSQYQNSLDKFVRKIYPPKNSDQNSIIERRDFHVTRRNLSHFWDTWAERRGIATKLRKKARNDNISAASNNYPESSDLSWFLSKAMIFYIRHKEFYQRVDMKEIVDEYGREKYSLVMLTWLDYAYRAHIGEKHQGKTYMYILANEIVNWHKMVGNSQRR